MRFADRVGAGRSLSARLERLGGQGVVVVGLPRGGMPVAHEVARAIGVPLAVIAVRKLRVPHRPELGLGAIGEDGICVLHPEVVDVTGVGEDEIAAIVRRERAELEWRIRGLRSDHPRVALRGRTAIVVDDGIATGSTARAACGVARAHGAARVILAVPVASRTALVELADAADELVCLQAPDPFVAVGEWYRDFSPVTDEEVLALLAER